MLEVKHIAALCGFALTLAAGQMLFKQAALTLPALGDLKAVPALIGNPWMWAALTLYGLATVLWVMILQQVPLSIAYVFAALSFVIVPIGAFLIFKEPLTVRYLVGAILIIGGIYLSAIG